MTNASATPEVDGGIIGQLLIGELPSWRAGVCDLYPSEDGDSIIVYDTDSGSVANLIDARVYRGAITDDGEVIDLPAVAEKVNNSLAEVHNEL